MEPLHSLHASMILRCCLFVPKWKMRSSVIIACMQRNFKSIKVISIKLLPPGIFERWLLFSNACPFPEYTLKSFYIWFKTVKETLWINRSIEKNKCQHIEHDKGDHTSRLSYDFQLVTKDFLEIIIVQSQVFCSDFRKVEVGKVS